MKPAEYVNPFSPVLNYFCDKNKHIPSYISLNIIDTFNI